MIRECFITAILLCLCFLTIPVVSICEEIRKEGWPVPDLNGLIPYTITLQTSDGVEKMVEKFYTSDGGHVARVSANGRVFAFVIDRDREPPIDYLLLDVDGSGKFTKRLKPGETYLIPDWVFR